MTRTEQKQKTIDKPVPTKYQQTRLQAEQQYNNLAALINHSFALVEIRNHRNLNQVRFNIS